MASMDLAKQNFGFQFKMIWQCNRVPNQKHNFSLSGPRPFCTFEKPSNMQNRWPKMNKRMAA